MVAMLGDSRPNPFCECAIVGLRTTFYIVMCDINISRLLSYGNSA